MTNHWYGAILAGFVVLAVPSICLGHACDDPWRPDPSNSGGPGSSGPEAPPAPPPPPPAPGDQPTGPGDPGVPNAPMDPGSSSLIQQPGSGSGSDSGNMSPDSIVLIPETSQLKIVGKKGEFRTYIVNRSPRDLFAVNLEAISPAFEIEVTPSAIRRLVSGEKDYFTVKLKLKGELKSGKFPMDFKVSSRGNLIYEGSLGQGADKAQTEVKENIGIRLKNEIVKIKQNGTFKVYVKNNIYNVINYVKVVCNSKYFIVQTSPGSVDKLSPGREAEFQVTLICQKGLKPGKYDIRLHAISSSRNVASSKIITIEVESGETRSAKR